MSPAAGQPERGWVLFDGSCGICRKWLGALDGILERRGFEQVPLQEEWVRERLGLVDEASLDELLRDLRVLEVDGTQHLGAQAYRHVMKCIWWALPLWLLSCVPGLRQLFDWSYRTFADNRHRLSHTCGLHPPES